VIIVDSTDPVGPGQILFQREFYANMKASPMTASSSLNANPLPTSKRHRCLSLRP
jgi:hypothetical protein